MSDHSEWHVIPSSGPSLDALRDERTAHFSELFAKEILSPPEFVLRSAMQDLALNLFLQPGFDFESFVAKLANYTSASQISYQEAYYLCAAANLFPNWQFCVTPKYVIQLDILTKQTETESLKNSLTQFVFSRLSDLIAEIRLELANLDR